MLNDFYTQCSWIHEPHFSFYYTSQPQEHRYANNKLKNDQRKFLCIFYLSMFIVQSQDQNAPSSFALIPHLWKLLHYETINMQFLMFFFPNVCVHPRIRKKPQSFRLYTLILYDILRSTIDQIILKSIEPQYYVDNFHPDPRCHPCVMSQDQGIRLRLDFFFPVNHDAFKLRQSEVNKSVNIFFQA